MWYGVYNALSYILNNKLEEPVLPVFVITFAPFHKLRKTITLHFTVLNSINKGRLYGKQTARSVRV